MGATTDDAKPNHQQKAKKRKERKGVTSLLELGARVAGRNLSLALIERRTGPVPDPVLRRLLFWAFPSDETVLRLYGPFSEALALIEAGALHNLLQIGFHLCGTVRSSSVDGVRSSYSVSIAFDRCKITAVKCSCLVRDVHWCKHAVAVALFRIRQPHNVPLRLPISETLNRMGRDQLQKLVQYLIAEHHTDVLATSQLLADQILVPSSSINRISGAPDPTAGPDDNHEHNWFIDEDQICSLVRFHLNQNGSSEQLYLLFDKVLQMLKRNDANGPKLLKLITEQFLQHRNAWAVTALRPIPPPLSDKLRAMWDQLGSIWVSVMLNRFEAGHVTQQRIEMLKNWMSISETSCTSSDDHYNPQKAVFQRAYEASQVSWSSDYLNKILNGQTDFDYANLPDSYFNQKGQALWTEQVPIACCRVESLRVHGHEDMALNLAVSVARSIRQAQHNWSAAQQDTETEGWISHPLNPINRLFDILSQVNSRSADTATAIGCKSAVAEWKRPRDSQDPFESFLSLALEVAIISLSQKRFYSTCPFGKEKAAGQEHSLVSKLRSLVLDECLMPVIKRQALFLIDGEWSGLSGDSLNTTPLHAVACFLFESLLGKDANLAYNLGLKSMRAQSAARGSLSTDTGSLTTWPASISADQTEQQQSDLAKAMLFSAKDDVGRLQKVLEAIDGCMSNCTAVCHLAHAIHQSASTLLPEQTVAKHNLQNAALELGLQVLRMTVGCQTWWPRRDMIRWLISCASAISVTSLQSLLRNWNRLFTPIEAAGSVAQLILAETLSLQSSLTANEQQELMHLVHQLAFQCVEKEPVGCALNALALCENDSKRFDRCFASIVSRGERVMAAQELFAVGRYLEQRNQTVKAFQITLLALDRTRINFGEEASPLTQDVYWACWLADRMERYPSVTGIPSPLHAVLNAIITNVRCANVLSAIVKGYVLGTSGFKKACWREEQRGREGSEQEKADLCLEGRPLHSLLEAALNAYEQTIETRLHHISPRHYNEFLDFLNKAKDTFLLASNGQHRFTTLITAMRLRFKGKKKLISLVSMHFLS